MFKVDQLRDLIIKPALQDLVMYSEEAAELLVFTCAVESEGGTYLHQVSGPALGIYQMEPATYNDIWQNYINNKPDLKLKLLHNFNAPVMPDEERLIYDLRFATAMCRIHYDRVNQPIPKRYIEEMYTYYKEFYNTSDGAATYPKSLWAYDLFIRSKS